MRIDVTIDDIKTGLKPIENAVRRQHGMEVTVDRKYIIFKGNERFPRRLPLSAEDFMYKVHTGQMVEPFSFEV